MRRSKPILIGELWGGFVADNGTFRQRLAEAQLPEVWRDVAGDTVAEVTESIDVKRGIMSVRITSSVLRHEVFMVRERYVREINARLGMQVVNYINVK